ncbi:hypothetical protein [Methylobacterium iners]|uniref:XRE family transcriptional regulator n=1 Tax=Methylobacterium iners TaxID=418707 RepID=A0ABQ4S2T8_9HYPH|nr:hypothetical protein [Methylobacterium iners]GJD97446.1 hypothetical protein OCOJLMKI_4677 [Methylobacterium iners]
MGRDPPPRWSPREDLPGQLDLVEYLASAPPPEPPHAPTGDAAPPLAEAPSYYALSRIGRAVHGMLWEGKIAPHLGKNPREVRRWRDGECAPSARTMHLARLWGLGVAADVLAAAGEPDLAKAVRRRRAVIKAEAGEPPPPAHPQKGAGGAS